MIIQEELKSSFSTLNVQVDPKTLEKCEQLCQTYRIEPEEFVDQWFAFTASRLNGAAPSISGLEQLERKELKQLAKQAQLRLTTNASTIETTPIRPLPITPLERAITPKTSHILPEPQQTPLINEEITAPHSERIIEPSDPQEIQLRVINYDESKTYRIMYEKVGTRQDCLNYITYIIGEKIKKFYALEDTGRSLKECLGEITIMGRVYSESGRMQLRSILFESTFENAKGYTTPLDLSRVEKTRLFPGQVVVVRGNNTRSGLIAQKIFTGTPAINLNHRTEFLKPVRIIVAAGPFTLCEDLTFGPLSSLIDYIVKSKPHCVILMGPFLPQDHKLLERLPEVYDSYFQSLIGDLMGRIGGCTKLVLIPSIRDIHGTVAYPTLPYTLNFKHPDLVLAPDPALIDIEGLLIGCTSVDVLSHLNDEDFVLRDGTNRIKNRMDQLAKYVVNQRCFYPLHPPNKEVPVDYQLMESMCFMETPPHLLVLPSNLKNFSTVIDECFVVNPEKAAKGNESGSFARVEINPGEGPVCNRTFCEIINL